MTAVPTNSRVELISDGTHAGTLVYLVIEDAEGHELRYKIPNVVMAEMSIDAREQFPLKPPTLLLGIGLPVVHVNVGIGPGRATIQDLMAEIAASRLKASDQ